MKCKYGLNKLERLMIKFSGNFEKIPLNCNLIEEVGTPICKLFLNGDAKDEMNNFSGKVGSGVEFVEKDGIKQYLAGYDDTSESYIELPSLGKYFNTNSDFAFGIFFYYDPSIPAKQYPNGDSFISFNSSEHYCTNFLLHSESKNIICYSGDDDQYRSVSKLKFNDKTEYHFGCSYNSKTKLMDLFIDGKKLELSRQDKMQDILNNRIVRINASSNRTSNRFSGYTHTFEFYDKQLGEEEFTKLANQKRCTKQEQPTQKTESKSISDCSNKTFSDTDETIFIKDNDDATCVFLSENNFNDKQGNYKNERSLQPNFKDLNGSPYYFLNGDNYLTTNIPYSWMHPEKCKMTVHAEVFIDKDGNCGIFGTSNDHHVWDNVIYCGTTKGKPHVSWYEPKGHSRNSKTITIEKLKPCSKYSLTFVINSFKDIKIFVDGLKVKTQFSDNAHDAGAWTKEMNSKVFIGSAGVCWEGSPSKKCFVGSGIRNFRLYHNKIMNDEEVLKIPRG